MGIKCCKSNADVKKHKFDFSEENMTNLKKMFDSLSEYNSILLYLQISGAKKHMQENSLLNLFPENQELGKLFYKWMASHSATNSVTLETFLAAIELISHSQENFYWEQYSHLIFEKYCVMLEIINQTKKLGDRENITSEEIVKFFSVKSLLRIFHNTSHDEANKFANMAFLGIFGEKKEAIPWKDFTLVIKKSLPHLNLIVENYFLGKLMTNSLSPKPIKMNQGSSLVKPEHFALIMMANNKLISNELTLLYSNLKDGNSFNRLAYSIQGYSGPTIILFEHIDHGESHQNIQKGDSFIFGAYSYETWNDHSTYTGDSQEFLFALTPKFTPIHTRKVGAKAQNYRYLYSKKSVHKHKIGLGFGGDVKYENFRIWIDDDMETESYTLPEDNTYETGYLVNASIRKLNIQTIEVWGLGGQEGLTYQEEFRKDDLKITESVRKLEKKGSSIIGDKHVPHRHQSGINAIISNNV